MRSYMGAGFKRRFLGLCLPPMMVALIDGVLTLIGQSDLYWSNHLAVNEANPVFRALLEIHPAAVLGGLGVWLALLCAMILLLPTRIALMLSIAITFGHTSGSASWLFDHFDLGYHLANGYYLLSACMLAEGVRHALTEATEPDRVLNLAMATRLKLGAAMFGVGVLAFLVPWQTG